MKNSSMEKSSKALLAFGSMKFRVLQIKFDDWESLSSTKFQLLKGPGRNVSMTFLWRLSKKISIMLQNDGTI